MSRWDKGHGAAEFNIMNDENGAKTLRQKSHSRKRPVCGQYPSSVRSGAHQAHTIEICINFYVNEAFRRTLVASGAQEMLGSNRYHTENRQCDRGIRLWVQVGQSLINATFAIITVLC